MTKIIRNGTLVVLTAAEETAFLADLPKPDLRAVLRDRRDAEMAAGVAFGSFAIQTDDISQGRIVGAALAAVVDPSLAIKWKTGSGTYVELSAAQVLAVAQVVRAHVQSCFDIEAELLPRVISGEIATADRLDAEWEAAAGRQP